MSKEDLEKRQSEIMEFMSKLDASEHTAQSVLSELNEELRQVNDRLFLHYYGQSPIIDSKGVTLEKGVDKDDSK